MNNNNILLLLYMEKNNLVLNYICVIFIVIVIILAINYFSKDSKSIQKWAKSYMLVNNGGKDIPCTIYCFQVNNVDEWALVYGNPQLDEYPLIRLQSQCVTGITLDDTECDCKQNMEFSKKMINENKNGGILFIVNQEGKNHGGIVKLKELSMRRDGIPETEVLKKLDIEWDIRNYGFIAEALNIIGVKNKIRLITRFPERVDQLRQDGVEVEEMIPYPYYVTKNNCEYMKMKKLDFNYNFGEIKC
jgi:GTP cyclohydrolase II